MLCRVCRIGGKKDCIFTGYWSYYPDKLRSVYRRAYSLCHTGKILSDNGKYIYALSSAQKTDIGSSLDEIIRSIFGEGRGSVEIEDYNGSHAVVFRLNGVTKVNNFEQLAELDKIMAKKQCFLETSKYTDTQLILIYVRE